MYQFQSEPPPDGDHHSLCLMRTPTNKGIAGIITSPDLVGTQTHFYHGRTIPCDNEECPACSEGFPWRWHAYCSLWSPATHRVVLFEMTAKCVEPLVTYRKAYGTLRGCHLTAKRATTSPNSRVIIQTKRADLENLSLPDGADILKALSIIWNITLPSLSVDGILKEIPRLNIKQNLPAQSSNGHLNPSKLPSHPPGDNGDSA